MAACSYVPSERDRQMKASRAKDQAIISEKRELKELSDKVLLAALDVSRDISYPKASHPPLLPPRNIEDWMEFEYPAFYIGEFSDIKHHEALARLRDLQRMNFICLNLDYPEIQDRLRAAGWRPTIEGWVSDLPENAGRRLLPPYKVAVSRFTPQNQIGRDARKSMESSSSSK